MNGSPKVSLPTLMTLPMNFDLPCFDNTLVIAAAVNKKNRYSKIYKRFSRMRCKTAVFKKGLT